MCAAPLSRLTGKRQPRSRRTRRTDAVESLTSSVRRRIALCPAAFFSVAALVFAAPAAAQSARECAATASACVTACVQENARAGSADRAARSSQLHDCRAVCNQQRQACQQQIVPASTRPSAATAPAATSAASPAALNPARAYDFVQLAAVDERIHDLHLRGRIGGRHYAVGENGSLAFGARLKDGGHGIFVADGRSLRTVAVTTPGGYTNLLIAAEFGLNRRGDVLFSTEMGPAQRVLVRAGANGHEILAEDGVLLDSNERGTALYLKSDGLYLLAVGRTEVRIGNVGGQAAINASDLVAFWDGESVAWWRDGRIAPQATPAPRMLNGWVRVDQPLKINNAGSYVLGVPLPQIPNGQALLLRSGGRSIPIADNSGDSYSRFIRADLNDRDEVAFVARMSNSINAAFVYRAGRVEPLSGMRTVREGVADIAINAGGFAVYGDHSGLWHGPDQETDKVVRRGDVLLGQPVSFVGLLGVNDAGQVFFNVGFGKGSRGTMLVRADPR